MEIEAININILNIWRGYCLPHMRGFELATDSNKETL